MAVDAPQSNALDVVLKYSAAIAALAYAGGFVEQLVYLYRLGVVGDVPLSNAATLQQGLMLCSAFVPSLLIGLDKSHPHQSWLFRLCIWSVIFVGVFLWVLFGVGAWVRDAVLTGAAGATLAVVAHKAWTDEGGLFRASPVTQAYGLYRVAMWFLIFAACVGQTEWRSLTQDESRRKVRLLVAPDAVAAAEQLGIAFPNQSTSQTHDAALSAPVQLLLEGERTYTVRIEKTHFASISKDKVWGFQSAK